MNDHKTEDLPSMYDLQRLGIPPELLKNPPQSDNYAAERVEICKHLNERPALEEKDVPKKWPPELQWRENYDFPGLNGKQPDAWVDDARCPRCDSTMLPGIEANHLVTFGCPVCKAQCKAYCVRCTPAHPTVVAISDSVGPPHTINAQCPACFWSVVILYDPPVKHVGEALKQAEGKLRLDLIDPLFEQGLAECLGYGAKKYADWNWLKGKPVSFYYAALRRHLTSWWAGEDIDPESKLHHLDHAACCLMFIRRLSTMKQWDDRVFRK